MDRPCSSSILGFYEAYWISSSCNFLKIRLEFVDLVGKDLVLELQITVKIIPLFRLSHGLIHLSLVHWLVRISLSLLLKYFS